MIDFNELNEKGWTTVSGVSSQADLVEVGHAIGTPTLTPNNDLVKEIHITPTDQALPGTQSFRYGRGSFPLHTDTVFWPLPIRYVVLRGLGDTRRPTTAASFPELLKKHDKSFFKLADRSIFLTGVEGKRFYCSLTFKHNGIRGWRYDADLMKPVNNAAKEIRNILRPFIHSQKVDQIQWSDDIAVIFANWIAMHGRGEQPENEQTRTIERLYVR